jgi:SSS family solute:Na+ symporter
MTRDNLLDLAVVIAYLIGITVYGLWVGRRSNKSASGYFLADRNFGWVMVGFSLFATNISIGAFVGGSGLAYKAGFASITPELQGGLMLVVSSLIFVPMFIRSRIMTIPQFLELRFNRTAKLLYGGIHVFSGILASPVGMFTGALAVIKLFGFELNASNVFIASACIAGTVGLYAIFGGMKSVVVTDSVQCVLMIAGGLLVTFVGLHEVGGWSVLKEKIGGEMFHLWRPANDPHFPWTAAIPGQLLHAAFFAFCNITLLQRALAARNIDQAQKGMLLGAFLKGGGILLFTLPGLIALALYPDAAKPDETYPMMVRDLLPAGLSGLVLAGLLAAMMSSQDSGINATAGVVALDLWPTVRPKASEREGVLVGKTFAASNIAFGVIAAPFLLGSDQGIYNMILKISGFMILPTGTVYLIGRFMRRANHQGAVATLLVGLLLGVWYIVCSTLPSLRGLLPEVVANAHFYHVYPVMFALLVVVQVSVSLLTSPPSPERLVCIAPMVKVPRVGTAPVWHRSFGFWLVVYLLCLVAIYSIFN